MSLGTEVGLGLRDIVLDGDPSPPSLKVQSPQFSANVGCGQTAGWIKKPLGTEVNLGPGDVVLMGSQLPLEGAQFSLDVYCIAKQLDGRRRHLVRRKWISAQATL